MTDQEKQSIVAHYLSLSNEGNVLPKEPTVNDLFDHCNLRRLKRWKRNRRLKKKFLKRWFRYVPKEICSEYRSKILANSTAEFTRLLLNRESIARRMFKVEPLPAVRVPDNIYLN